MSFVDEDDASRVMSIECFNTWVATRQTYPKQPEESFRRVLIGHICGIDRRRPFPARVESSLLKIVRKKEVWECFKGSDVSIGIRGFRKKGFHEVRRLQQRDVKQERKAPLRTRSPFVQSIESQPKTIGPNWKDPFSDEPLGFFEGFERVVAKSDLRYDIKDSLSDVAFDAYYFDAGNGEVKRQRLGEDFLDSLTIF